MSEWVRIAAPATTSNIGAGFDVFGLAFHEPYDIVEGRKIESGIVISSIEGPGADLIPTDPEKNSVTIALKEVLKRAGADFGVEVKIIKGIRPGSGMGSSGASSAGGAYLGHMLTGEKLPINEVVMCAAVAEGYTSGTMDADNVAPCILGGFTIIRSYEPFEVLRIEPPKNLGLVVALPDVVVLTAESRAVLPESVKIKDLVYHVGHASSLVYAMMTGDLALVGRAVGDVVFEPARAKLIPHLKEAEKAAMSHGAIVSFLGGSGPCVMSFYDKDTHKGDIIAESVKKVFNQNGLKCDVWVTECGTGCRRL